MKNHWLAVRIMRTLKMIDIEDDLRPEYNLRELKPVPWNKTHQFRRAKARADAAKMRPSPIHLHKKAVIKEIMEQMQKAAPRKWLEVTDMSCPTFNKLPYIKNMTIIMADEMGHKKFNKDVLEVIDDCSAYVFSKINVGGMVGMIPMMIESRLLTHVKTK